MEAKILNFLSWSEISVIIISSSSKGRRRHWKPHVLISIRYFSKCELIFLFGKNVCIIFMGQDEHTVLQKAITISYNILFQLSIRRWWWCFTHCYVKCVYHEEGGGGVRLAYEMCDHGWDKNLKFNRNIFREREILLSFLLRIFFSENKFDLFMK